MPRAVAAMSGPSAAPQERVLFPFDDYSVPFNKGVLLTLVPGRKSATADPLCITSPQSIAEAGGRIYVNADGLSANNHLKVELLDELFRPIAGYSADDCVPVVKAGFRTPVAWKGGNLVKSDGKPVRVRVSWGGDRPDCRLYAIYVE